MEIGFAVFLDTKNGPMATVTFWLSMTIFKKKHKHWPHCVHATSMKFLFPVPISCCSSHVQLFVTPWTACSMPGFIYLGPFFL